MNETRPDSTSESIPEKLAFASRWRERLAMEPICQWIKEGKLSADEFVTHRFNIADLEKALAAVKSGEALKVLMTF